VQTWLNYPTALEIAAERYVAGSLRGYDEIPANAVSSRHTFFYNASHSAGGPDNDTHVTVMNPTDTANHYAIEIYDAYGTLIDVEYGVVNPKTVSVHRFAQPIVGPRDFAVGLCVVRAETCAYEQFAVNLMRLRDSWVIESETIP
jgi:hypothetical protein